LFPSFRKYFGGRQTKKTSRQLKCITTTAEKSCYLSISGAPCQICRANRDVDNVPCNYSLFNWHKHSTLSKKRQLRTLRFNKQLTEAKKQDEKKEF